ncbi:MAG: hypothetical protein U5K31_04540 [Balneolaceae bacterium]|nr:hypothetical protein [Balneolaceae bacterium]
MTAHRKKQLLVLLLFLSCVASAWLLATAEDEPPRRLDDLARVDSLLQADFREFYIRPGQVQSWQVEVDSNFARRVYLVSLPGGFSKTQLHARIQRSVNTWGMSAPARVVFPQRDMEIQLIWRNTVVRTVRLQTDPELEMNRNLATILIAFDYPPSEELQQRFRQMGEALHPVMAIGRALEAGTIRQEWQGGGGLTEPILWLRDAEGRSVPGSGGGLSLLQQVEGAMPQARVLSFVPAASSGEAPNLSRYALDFIPASQARVIQAAMGRADFIRALDAFAAEAQAGERPLLLVHASGEAFDWLQDRLPEYKRGGLTLIPPQQGP